METEIVQPATKTTSKKTKKAPAKKPASRAVAVHRPSPPAAPAPRNLLEVVATAVMDPRCDVAKMQALLDMQERVEEREAKKAFTIAFNALQAELPIINRDGKIDHGDGLTAKGNRKLKTSFATYPNLNRVCGPLMKKHGFTFSTSMEPEASGAMVAVSTLEHIGGASRSTRFRLTADSTGGKNNQQGWGSSQQYGMRYNMIALLNIVSEAKEDADNDGFPVDHDPKTITEKQAAELIKLLDDAGGDKRKFCEAMGVDGIALIAASDFEVAKTRIKNYRKAKEEAQRKASDFPGDRK